MSFRTRIRQFVPGALALSVAGASFLALPAIAQQITGTAGSADATTTVSAGKHTIVFDFKYNGPGPGKGGIGVLSVAGKEAARTIPHTIPLLIAIEETFDGGVDTRTPVDDFAYELPFRFTGTIDRLNYKLGREQLTAEEKKAGAEIIARARD